MSEYRVLAKTRTGDEATVRAEAVSLSEAENIARRIAGSSLPEGAVSVWVEGSEGVVWAAGEKVTDRWLETT